MLKIAQKLFNKMNYFNCVLCKSFFSKNKPAYSI